MQSSRPNRTAPIDGKNDGFEMESFGSEAVLPAKKKEYCWEEGEKEKGKDLSGVGALVLCFLQRKMGNSGKRRLTECERYHNLININF